MSGRRFRLAQVGVAASIAVGLVSVFLAVGQIARTPVLLTIFFSGFAAGASLTSLLRRGGKGGREALRREASGDPEA